MFPFINPTPLILAMTTLFGVVTHEMHIDRAAMLAVALPAVITTVGVDKVISNNYHTHVDRTSIPKNNILRTSLPNSNPPRDEDRKHLQNKKFSYDGGGDQGYIWPSD